QDISGSPLLIVRSPRLNLEGYELFISQSEAMGLWDDLMAYGKDFGLKAIGEEVCETLRIESGVARFTVDMTEDTIPLEAGLDHAISFTKGCYVGQEVVTRMKHRGHPNWSLLGLMASPGISLSVGQKLTTGEKDVGHVTSATQSPTLGRSIALARVRRSCEEVGTKLRITGLEEDHEIVVSALPFC
ncbi:MAG: aminomethyl transferase family protein, partial [Spirochaetota bacterium]|nr:aminomethyl transferase family protein [Spirochaetota bacterium]